jgi:hypothetical protein
VIVVTSLTQTCPSHPAQWEGTTADGRVVYVRYRWGYLQVRVDGGEVFGAQLGGQWDGEMTYDELKQHTQGVMVWP